MSRAPRPLTLLVALVLALPLALAGLVGAAGSAAAHAKLESSDPKDGATLAAVPPAVVLVFGEEIEPSLVRARVEFPGGQVDVDPDTDGDTVSISVSGTEQVAALAPAAANGAYRVVFRVVSADGHPISGAIRFTVAAPAPAPAPPAPTPTGTTSPTPAPPATSSASPSVTPTTAPSAAPTAAATPDDTSTPGLVPVASPGTEPTGSTSSASTGWVVGLGVLVLAALAGLLVARRRRTP